MQTEVQLPPFPIELKRPSVKILGGGEVNNIYVKTISLIAVAFFAESTYYRFPFPMKYIVAPLNGRCDSSKELKISAMIIYSTFYHLAVKESEVVHQGSLPTCCLRRSRDCSALTLARSRSLAGSLEILANILLSSSTSIKPFLFLCTLSCCGLKQQRE